MKLYDNTKGMLFKLVSYAPQSVIRLVSTARFFINNFIFSLQRQKNNFKPNIISSLEDFNPIVLTTMFNPGKSGKRIELYQKFAQSLNNQGVPLATVELVHEKNDYQLNDSSQEILVQFKTKSILWQKERLYNLALHYIPSRYNAIIFLDADVIYDNAHWIELVIQQLSQFKVVQPFAQLTRLNNSELGSEAKIFRYGFFDGQTIGSCVRNVHTYGLPCLAHPFVRGSVGIGLAVRRTVLEQCNLYDAAIVGGGDHINMFASLDATVPFSAVMSNRQLEHYNQWKNRWYKTVQNSVSYANVPVYHMFHGNHLKKQKWNRHLLTKNYNFDPLHDIELDQNGVWQWASDKFDLHRMVEKYFTTLDSL